MNKLGHVVFYVRELEPVLRFMQVVLDWTPSLIAPDTTYVEYCIEGKVLAFACVSIMPTYLGVEPLALEALAPLGLGHGGQLSVVVADLTSVADKAVAAGATIIKPPNVMPWGHTVAFVLTPFNLLLELGQTMK
jgi:lactoylglutathione lyase